MNSRCWSKRVPAPNNTHDPVDDGFFAIVFSNISSGLMCATSAVFCLTNGDVMERGEENICIAKTPTWHLATFTADLAPWRGVVCSESAVNGRIWTTSCWLESDSSALSLFDANKSSGGTYRLHTQSYTWTLTSKCHSICLNMERWIFVLDNIRSAGICSFFFFFLIMEYKRLCVLSLVDLGTRSTV